jgi:hypothetical protein
MVLGFGGPFWGGERELEFLVEGDCENSWWSRGRVVLWGCHAEGGGWVGYIFLDRSLVGRDPLMWEIWAPFWFVREKIEYGSRDVNFRVRGVGVEEAIVGVGGGVVEAVSGFKWKVVAVGAKWLSI